MQINYLCPKHADWVYGNPDQALHVMARDEMQGTLLMQCDQASEAIPYLGCAFDIAVILLEIDGGETPAMIKKLTQLSQLLEDAYFQVNLPLYRNAIVDRTHAILSAVNRTSSRALTFNFTL